MNDANTPGVADLLEAEFGAAAERAATKLLIAAAQGVWPERLSGWPGYLRPVDDFMWREGLWIDWQTIRADLAADAAAIAEFRAWADLVDGQDTDEDEREDTYARRCAHGHGIPPATPS